MIPQAQDLLAAESTERGKQVVLIIDEAHLLDAECLEGIRCLSNIGMDQAAPFCLLLLGQPTLRRRLRQGTFAALDQRIAVRYAITGLGAAETTSYVRHHLALAGRSDTLFSDYALALIHEVSRGLPRQVNNLAVGSLIAAFSAKKAIVDESAVRQSGRRGLRRMTEQVVLSLLGQPPNEDPQLSRELTLPVPADWPASPEATVYHGLAGEIVGTIAPETEADPVAILSRLLVAFGAAVGRGGWFQVEATRHHANEFLVLVGDSSRARKGSSWDHVHRLLTGADPAITARILTGLSSGEGLIWSVRDPQGQDPGASDRRLLVIEPEFVSVLKAASREISTLSPTLRSAWDGRPLQILTRTTPLRATDAHISVIGHITATELRHHINPVELANGLLNRFLLLSAAAASDCSPKAATPTRSIAPAWIAGSPKRSPPRHAGQLRLSTRARHAWSDADQRLAEPQPGIAGAIGARAEAHTIRLALIYALLDNNRQIQPAHLDAALALWDYAQRSASWALERTAADPLAKQIHAALKHALPDGLTRTQLRDLLHRNPTTTQLDQALAALANDGKITSQRVLTTGRPAELRTATR